MKEKINKIYDSKAIFYYEIIQEFDKNEINYVLLNFIYPDQNPGDLDIMVNKNEKNRIELILKKFNFSCYTEFNTDQFLWHKYIQNIGFVQFHLYFGLSFMNQVFFKKIPKIENIASNNEFHFFVFLVESFFRNTLKKDIYTNFLKSSSSAQLFKFVDHYSPKSKKFIESILVYYKKNSLDHKLKSYFYLDDCSFFKLFRYYLNKIKCKFLRIGNKSDKKIFIIGVDGSGKSSLINNMNKVLSKGGVFSKLFYFGLKGSFLNKISLKLKKNKIISISNSNNLGYTNLNVIKFLKISLYWIEYNILFFLYVYLNPNSSKTIYIFDRSYIDLIYYHPFTLTEKLFLNYSFFPSKVILLSGNAKNIYRRKQDYSIEALKHQSNFYKKIINKYSSLKVETKTIDSTINNENECNFKAISFVLNK